MKRDILRDAEKYTKAHQRKKRWHQVVTVLACVVVFCTTYALILPAITMEKQCDIPEHTHTEAYYTQVTSVEKKVPVCSAETLEIHQHTDSCYDADGNLICGYANFVVHHHDSTCYDENGNLWCQLPEIETHEHTDSCYAMVEGTSEEVHTHTDACYTLEQGELVCTESTESAHVHTDDCYEWNRVLTCDLPTEPEESDAEEDAEPVLVCTKPEIVLHRHTSDCFDADGNLICGQIQVLEHQHTDACFETVTEPIDTEALTCTNTDPDHVHTALCYGTWELTCGMEEHTHSEACTQSEPEETVFCGKDAHTHGEGCWDENGELVCTLEEHSHSLACYSDPSADVETA